MDVVVVGGFGFWYSGCCWRGDWACKSGHFEQAKAIECHLTRTGRSNLLNFENFPSLLGSCIVVVAAATTTTTIFFLL